MSIFFNICIGLLAAGTIAAMLGLIGMGIADRKERKTAERLEDERKSRYGGYGAKERLCKYSCKDCDNAKIIDGKPICHCFDILKVESKRPQCPYFKDKIEG